MVLRLWYRESTMLTRVLSTSKDEQTVTSTPLLQQFVTKGERERRRGPGDGRAPRRYEPAGTEHSKVGNVIGGAFSLHAGE